MRSLQLPLLALVPAAALVPSAAGQGATLYATDFSNLDGWSVEIGCEGEPYVWAADATPADHFDEPFRSAPASLNFNDGTDIGGGGPHGGGPVTCGKVTSDPIDLSAAFGTPLLRFWASWEMEADCVWDVLSVTILSDATGDVLDAWPCLNDTYQGPWEEFELPLDRSWGAVRVEFGFDTGDDWSNEGSGPFIDDLEIVDTLTVFCVGDGSEGACPCGNESGAGELAGCRNSTGAAGTTRASGRASLSDDTLVLHGAGMPDQPALYFQAATQNQGVAFGDGLRCAGGPFIRLGARVNSGGASSFPGPGEGTISELGMVTAPGVKHYQIWYRDPAPFCTPETFNYTNAVSVTWEL